jgi:ABC-2 type transport system ATP-binding protein
MRKLGKKQLAINLLEPIASVPDSLSGWDLVLNEAGDQLVYSYELDKNDGHVGRLLQALEAAGLHFDDLSTRQTSLEDIFVSLIGAKA